MQSEADVPVAAQRQAEDLLNIKRRLAQLGIGDASRTAAIGHSLGARAALLLAMHDSSVKALVSLDGGIGTASAIDAFKRAPWFSLSRPVPPVLHMYESADPFMAPDFSLLRALRSPNLVLRELTGLHHVHFSTLGFQASRDGVDRATHELWRSWYGVTASDGGKKSDSFCSCSCGDQERDNRRSGGQEFVSF